MRLHLQLRRVGIRELTNSLSEYLRRVRLGESVLVTDRGEIVAQLTPPGQSASGPSVPPALAALAKRRIATVGSPGDASLYRPLPRRGRRKVTSTQLLDEER